MGREAVYRKRHEEWNALSVKVYPDTRSQIWELSYGYLDYHQDRTDWTSTGSMQVPVDQCTSSSRQCTSMHPDAIPGQTGKAPESLTKLIMLALQ